jgi:arabinogalactan oligomer / maltooligosaccharide transport system permease protein
MNAVQTRGGRVFGYTWRYVLAVVLIIFAVIPFIWVVSTSFNAAKSLTSAQLIPTRTTLNNYSDLLSSKTLNFSRWMVNSLKVTVISVSCILFLTSMASYALSRFKFRSKRTVMMGIMLINVFPGILALIALFTMFQQIGMFIPGFGLNTHAALIAVYVAGAMSINTLMVKAYIDTIPQEIDESCLVEGASYWQTFWIVVFPMIRPIVITAGILAFMATYGDFIIANLILKGNDSLTVMVGIFRFTQQRFDTDWGVVTAGTVIAAVPTVSLFFFAQKYIITGLTSGAVKQ